MHSLALKENAFISFKGENPVVVPLNLILQTQNGLKFLFKNRGMN